MQIVALLRGVIPIGKNKIPKMSYVVQILEEAGFEKVQTYIQSGNILIDTNLSYEKIAAKIHDVIYEKIGADLSVIIKNKEEFEVAIKNNPFDNNYDYSRIHMEKNMMNKEINKNELILNLDKLHTTDLGVIRIKKNLSLKTDDVVMWCKTKIESKNATITKKGKNWYVKVENYKITINSYSYTIITAHTIIKNL